jgi:NAD(P)-dependent dehydrogenase (short-subunit alcohol dehydrogenase family)
LERELTGRVALITGASSGIGAATAVRLAAAGADCALVGRREGALEQIRSACAGGGAAAQSLVADVTDPPAAAAAVAATIQRFGRLDILVNAAGVIASGALDSTSLDSWDAMFAINVRSVFHLMQLCRPHLALSRGCVVNVSSVAGLRSFPGVIAYAASKAALDQLTRCAALELAASGVRVNAVNPGVVVTELHRRGGMDPATYQAFLERSKSTHPLGRVGKPEEIADLILFLASPRAAWITGETIAIDGGRAQTCLR